MQADSSPDPAAQVDWERIRPILDEALAELDERDREAILLRYLGGCDYAQVGAELELSDNAARMRVDRAVEKLRTLLARRGATSTAAALSLALANQAVVAAPAGLAATVTGAAIAGAGTTATVTFMSLTKLQIGFAGVVLVTGAGIYAVQAQDNAALRAELANVRPAALDISRLRQENQQLERTSSRAADLQVSDAELARLQGELVAQQQRLQAMARPAPPPKSDLKPSLPVGVSLGNLDERPRINSQAAPAYPPAMAAAGIDGSVVVSFVIDANGVVRDARAVKSTRSEFEAAAVEAVSKWRFDAGRKGGRAVNTRVTQLLAFDHSGKTGSAPAPDDWF